MCRFEAWRGPNQSGGELPGHQKFTKRQEAKAASIHAF